MSSPSAKTGGEGGRFPWLFLALLAALPALHALLVLGRIHPDEVYQWLEPAYFRVHGYGVLAWEWRVGLRNWAGPLFIAAWLKLAQLLGWNDPRAYRALVELPQFFLHLGALAATYRYARRRAGPRGSLLAAALVGLYGLTVIFAGRTLGESFSASFLVMGLDALDSDRGEKGRGIPPSLAAGMLFGWAVVFRYGSIPAVAGVLLWLLGRRQWRALGLTVAGGAAVALVLGGLDWATWGKPFHSLWEYLQFNVFSGQAARQFGAEPFGFYFSWFAQLLPWWLPLGLGAMLAFDRPRVSAGLFASLLYFLSISLTPHKEIRFLYPGLFMLCFAAAPGVGLLYGWIPSAAGRWAVALICVGFTSLPFFNHDWPELRGDQFRAQVKATREGATGLLIVNEGIWGAGGYFYSGKNIPWTVADYGNQGSFLGAMADPRFNRAITFEGRAAAELTQAGFRPVEQVGRETIFAR